jgi:hypothetical protein
MRVHAELPPNASQFQHRQQVESSPIWVKPPKSVPHSIAEGRLVGKLLTPDWKRSAVSHARQCGMSERHACCVVNQPRSRSDTKTLGFRRPMLAPLADRHKITPLWGLATASGKNERFTQSGDDKPTRYIDATESSWPSFLTGRGLR